MNVYVGVPTRFEVIEQYKKQAKLRRQARKESTNTSESSLIDEFFDKLPNKFKSYFRHSTSSDSTSHSRDEEIKDVAIVNSDA